MKKLLTRPVLSVLMLVGLLCALPLWCASAEEARDITAACSITVHNKRATSKTKFLDGKYHTYERSCRAGWCRSTRRTSRSAVC